MNRRIDRGDEADLADCKDSDMNEKSVTRRPGELRRWFGCITSVPVLSKAISITWRDSRLVNNPLLTSEDSSTRHDIKMPTRMTYMKAIHQ